MNAMKHPALAASVRLTGQFEACFDRAPSVPPHEPASNCSAPVPQLAHCVVRRALLACLRNPHTATARARGGATLIELLAVLGIVLVLASLGLPAIQAARGSARRSQCANNLSQIGKACAAHESSRHVLPWNCIGMPPHDLSLADVIHVFSAHLWLLPHLDQGKTYDGFNFPSTGLDPNVGNWVTTPHPSNLTTAKTKVSAFLCPSDPQQFRFVTEGTNYRCNIGYTTFRKKGNDYVLGNDLGGAFVPSRPLRTSMFSDGLSHTILFSEKPRGYPGKELGNRNPFDRFVGYWSKIADYDSADSLVTLCGSLQGQPDQYTNLVGHAWVLPGLVFTSYGHDAVPNSQVPDCTGSLAPHGSFAARSFHGAGVNCLLADGSVRYIDDAIDRTLWRAMATRAGHETKGNSP